MLTPRILTPGALLPIVIALLPLLAGCFDLNAPGDSLEFEFADAGDPDNACDTALDCARGFICVNNQCVEGCLSDLDCELGQQCRGTPPMCIAAGECTFDADCTGGERCFQGESLCVPCLDNLDCSGGLVCRVSFECATSSRPCTADDFACSSCSSDAECPSGTSCDTDTGACVECLDDGDCTPGLVCDPERRFCTRCATDDDCSDNELQPACMRTEQGSECVGCVDDADCPEGTCNRDLLSCEGCRSHSDCDSDALRCNPVSGLCYDTACSFRDTPELIEVTIQATLPAPFLAGPLGLGPFRDGDNSGVIDRADQAAVVAPLAPQGPSDRSTVALALTGQRLWSASSVGGATRGVALGDLDGDTRPETVVLRGDRLVAHDISGSTVWTSASRTSHLPGLFDVDQDGFAEIVAGGSLFSEAGSRVWLGDAHQGTHSPDLHPGVGLAANLDDDPQLEIVAGGTVYSTQGETRCSQGADGYTAIADLGGAPGPELVVVSGDGAVRALSAACELRWGPITPEGAGGGGGLPAIADTDGDGTPEIAYVAGPDVLALVGADGAVRWTTPLDRAHPTAGATLIDLDGDRALEVVVSDSSSVKILRAADGFLLTEHPQGGSQVPFNTPYALDVDADGATELVVAAGSGEALDQIVVFGDVRDRWTATRNVWNQTAYIAEGIADNMTIPVILPAWWEESNAFRAQTSGTGAVPAPNVTLSTLLGAVELGECPDRYTIVVGLNNRGSLTVPPGVTVEARFNEIDTGSLLEVASTTRLEPGDRETVTLTFDDLRGPVDVLLRAARPADQEALLPECSLEDNTLLLEGIGCPDGFEEP